MQAVGGDGEVISDLLVSGEELDALGICAAEGIPGVDDKFDAGASLGHVCGVDSGAGGGKRGPQDVFLGEAGDAIVPAVIGFDELRHASHGECRCHGGCNILTWIFCGGRLDCRESPT